MRRTLIPAVVLAMIPSGIAAQSAPNGPAAKPLPPAQEIIDRMIDRARRAEEKKLAEQYTYEQQTVIEKLDASGAVKEREERVYQPVALGSERYLRLVKKNGRPPNGKDLKEEQEREKQFRQRLDERRRKGKKDGDDIRFDSELTSRFRGEVLGREHVNGRWAYLIRFEPKSRDLPVRRRLDRLLNKLAGRLWVDEEDYTIVRGEGRLLEPVRVGLGLLASFQKLDITAEQTRLEDGLWLPVRLDALVQGRVIFNTIHQRQALRWREFRRVEPPRPQPATGPH